MERCLPKAPTWSAYSSPWPSQDYVQHVRTHWVCSLHTWTYLRWDWISISLRSWCSTLAFWSCDLNNTCQETTITSTLTSCIVFTSSSRFDCTRFQVHCHSKVAHDGHAPIAPSCPQHPSKQLWCLVSGSSLKCRQEKIRQATGLVWCATLEYDSRLDITSVTERYVDEAGNRRSYSRPPYQAISGMRLKCYLESHYKLALLFSSQVDTPKLSCTTWHTWLGKWKLWDNDIREG